MLETVAIYLNLFWRSVYQRDLNCGMCEYSVVCPAQDECAATASNETAASAYDACRCGSAKFDSQYNSVKDDPTALSRLVDDALRSNRISSALLNAQFKTELWRNISGRVTFLGDDDEPLDPADNEELKIFLAKLVLHPAKVSPFATPLAATNDPLFWSSHSNWERVWHYVQLDPMSQYRIQSSSMTNKTAEALKMFWDVVHADPSEMNICWGRYWEAKLPFSGFLGESPELDYTNGELLQLFQPENPKLPFVYDSFHWYHCRAGH